MVVEERKTEANGLLIRYLTAGEGPPLLLLHALGESALDWRWVLSDLARTHRVYAPDLPGFGDSAKPAADYSPAFFERFAAAFLDALEVERTAVIGNSLGGLIALRLALSESSRISALALIDSAGLGREVSSALKWPALPGYGEAAITLSKTPLGATQRAWLRIPLLFARPERVPPEWIEEQYRLSQLPGFSQAVVAALRAQVDPGGQREVLLDRLPSLEIPTLVVWGESDRIFPVSQARDAVAHLREGSLELVPDCGHLPHVERPKRFVAALDRFLGEQA
jgi:2-hydroxy-6-oxonona-2,4-dienedioate hydrolase